MGDFGQHAQVKDIASRGGADAAEKGKTIKPYLTQSRNGAMKVKNYRHMTSMTFTGRGLCKTLETMATPFSVKAYGGVRLPPH